MENRFLYRGQKVDTDELYYGSLIQLNDKFYILVNETGDLDDIDFGYGFVEIKNPQQCTGYKDKKGKLVYHGDFVKSYNDEICLIDFDDEYGCLWIKSDFNSHPMHNLDFKFEVIGNIYETPELLEVAE